jgi:hypothetical protein
LCHKEICIAIVGQKEAIIDSNEALVQITEDIILVGRQRNMREYQEIKGVRNTILMKTEIR